MVCSTGVLDSSPIGISAQPDMGVDYDRTMPHLLAIQRMPTPRRLILVSLAARHRLDHVAIANRAQLRGGAGIGRGKERDIVSAPDEFLVSHDTISSVPPYFSGGTVVQSGATSAIRNILLVAVIIKSRLTGSVHRKCEEMQPIGHAPIPSQRPRIVIAKIVSAYTPSAKQPRNNETAGDASPSSDDKGDPIHVESP